MVGRGVGYGVGSDVGRGEIVGLAVVPLVGNTVGRVEGVSDG